MIKFPRQSRPDEILTRKKGEELQNKEINKNRQFVEEKEDLNEKILDKITVFFSHI